MMLAAIAPHKTPEHYTRTHTRALARSRDARVFAGRSRASSARAAVLFAGRLFRFIYIYKSRAHAQRTFRCFFCWLPRIEASGAVNRHFPHSAVQTTVRPSIRPFVRRIGWKMGGKSLSVYRIRTTVNQSENRSMHRVAAFGGPNYSNVAANTQFPENSRTFY